MKLLLSQHFINGFIRAINLSGTKEWPDIHNSYTKDYLALRRDWENVGNSIQRELTKFEKNGYSNCRSDRTRS